MPKPQDKQQIEVVCPQCGSINRLAAERLGAGGRCGRCHQPLFMGVPTELDEMTFTRHLKRDSLPLLVDFWAPWCAPCRMMAPVIADAARRLEPAVRVAKLDTEAHPAVAQRFAIRSIPTLALFRDGREVARTAGAMDIGRVLDWVHGHLATRDSGGRSAAGKPSH